MNVTGIYSCIIITTGIIIVIIIIIITNYNFMILPGYSSTIHNPPFRFMHELLCFRGEPRDKMYRDLPRLQSTTILVELGTTIQKPSFYYLIVNSIFDIKICWSWGGVIVGPNGALSSIYGCNLQLA